MSRTLSANVALWGPGGTLVTLAPGDELPGWAEDKVGDHCLVPDALVTELLTVDPAEYEDPEVDQDLDAETKPDEAGPDAEELDATDAAPDFTAAAPRRNSRSRK